MPLKFNSQESLESFIINYASAQINNKKMKGVFLIRIENESDGKKVSYVKVEFFDEVLFKKVEEIEIFIKNKWNLDIEILVFEGKCFPEDIFMCCVFYDSIQNLTVRNNYKNEPVPDKITSFFAKVSLASKYLLNEITESFPLWRTYFFEDGRDKKI